MSKFKKKIHRKYSDFFTPEDLFEPKGPRIHLSITDLDAKGHLVNPKAPCVVTTIDPKYREDANRQGAFRKFNVKSDILRLRDITRKKFILYVTQQRALEKAREQEFQTRIYTETKHFLNMAGDELTVIQSESFASMLAENDKLKKLQSVPITDEMKECVVVNQKLSMEVKDVHKRFLFLLKLIGYFDGNDDPVSTLKQKRLGDARDFLFLKSDLLSDQITPDYIKELKHFLAGIVKPYLNKRTNLDANIWIAGYENTRHKLFEYYNQFTKLAILNHIVSIVHYKFMKSYNTRVCKPIVHNTPTYLRNRKTYLENKAVEVLTQFEQDKAKSKIYCKIEGVAPVMLKKICPEDNNRESNSAKATTIDNLEHIHSIVMGLLNELDTLDPDHCKFVEEDVRRCVAGDRRASRKVLVKVNRFQNWIEHYKNHVKQNK